MRKMLGMAMIMATMADSYMNPQERKTRIEDIDLTRKKKPIPAGCKKYKFGDFETIASSEKKAIEKYNKWLKRSNN